MFIMAVQWEDDEQRPLRKRLRCARCAGWFVADVDPDTGRPVRLSCGSCAGQKVLFAKPRLRKRGGR